MRWCAERSALVALTLRLDVGAQPLVDLAIVLRLLLGSQDRHRSRRQHDGLDAPGLRFHHHRLVEAMVGQGRLDVLGEDVEPVGQHDDVAQPAGQLEVSRVR